MERSENQATGLVYAAGGVFVYGIHQRLYVFRVGVLADAVAEVEDMAAAFAVAVQNTAYFGADG